MATNNQDKAKEAVENVQEPNTVKVDEIITVKINQADAFIIDQKHFVDKDNPETQISKAILTPSLLDRIAQAELTELISVTGFSPKEYMRLRVEGKSTKDLPKVAYFKSLRGMWISQTDPSIESSVFNITPIKADRGTKLYRECMRAVEEGLLEIVPNGKVDDGELIHSQLKNIIIPQTVMDAARAEYRKTPDRIVKYVSDSTFDHLHILAALYQITTSNAEVKKDPTDTERIKVAIIRKLDQENDPIGTINRLNDEFKSGIFEYTKTGARK